MNGANNVNSINMLAQQQQLQSRVKIGVRNWQNATVQDLMNFLSRTTRISVVDAVVEGPLVVGYVASRADAESLLKWNGIRFAGNNLKFEILSGTGNDAPGTNSTITLLKNFLYKRYNAQTKMLDLGNLHADPDLVQKGLFSSMSTQSKMFPALMKLTSKEPQLVVESVNLSDNNLKDISGITTLAQTFPHLKNLCLANNQISRFRTIEVWKNKFKELRELLMVNNPITSDKLYRSEMMRLFPKLVILDNVMVRDEQKLTSIYSIPMKIQPFFFENNEIGPSSTDFVTNFLNFWDTDRMQLLGLYTPQSQFSISVDSSIPPSSVAESDQNPSFGYYLPYSRNISKVSSEKSIEQRLSLGPEAMSNLFGSIPKTKHHLQDMPDEYSMQTVTYPQINGFVVTLHGFYEEVGKPDADANNKTSAGRSRRFNHGHNSTNNRLFKKSFDRTWVIVPAGGGVVIASEMLTVRPFAANAWVQQSPAIQKVLEPQPQPQPPLAPQIDPMNPSFNASPPPQPQMGVGGLPVSMGVSPQQQPPMPPVSTPVPLAPTLQLPLEVQARLNPIQLELLNKLHLETKLNAEYTFILAEQSGWNYEVATKGFQNSVNNIPREAFIP
ncbi:nuclear mRNA export, poly(A)+RNA binding protein [Zygosaccharomyces mellis]|uniref:mRNA export factor MEX67 n=1 Tax=Zygosaccharomyces mellis TaxID=42258 RepID=A0A4C2E3C2_9SACH|nr:nuclear mRNA export, poly(A)+RNA binding protein [Zygosaccharomyces mellis]